jgi:hypothetical protein
MIATKVRMTYQQIKNGITYSLPRLENRELLILLGLLTPFSLRVFKYEHCRLGDWEARRNIT